jgi:hypothetical protein
VGGYLTEHPVVSTLAFGGVFGALIAAVVWFVPGAGLTPGTEPPEGPEPPAAELVGNPPPGGLDQQVPDRPALVVKVSNSPEARPQTGLDLADVVLEELTEGGVTRFITVLHSQLPEVVGPVRSARPVDLQVVSGFGRPGFAFSGARPEVLAALGSAAAVPLTEGAPGFFRDDGRYASHPVAPHDLFLELAPAIAAVEERGGVALGDLGWRFSDDPPEGGTPAVSLEIPMSHAYVTGWAYDGDAGRYRREQNGEPARVTGAGRIGAANVVVLAVRHYVGASGYPETDVLGSGEALVLRDGLRYPARWEKTAATSPLRILDADGEPFPFARGPTWMLLPDRLPAASPG